MDVNEYKWIVTDNIQHQLQELEVLKKVFENIPHTPINAKKLLRKSILNSAVSSARIEDIPSTPENPRREGQNLIKAYTDIYQLTDLPQVSIEVMKKMHSMVLNELSGSAGQYRVEQWGVFNQAGMEIHHAPLHTLVPELMQQLVSLIEKLEGQPPAIVASVAQFIFEKIHPFADGNGRAGRLLTAYMLQRSGFGFGGLVSLERYIESNRLLYYQALQPSHDCTEFIEFILSGIIFQSQQTLEEIKNPKTIPFEDTISPRRREILGIIRDHPECSFDFLYRRFIATENKIAIHRDLAFLQKNGLIRKLGETKGVVYVANTDIL